ncbi:baseplate J/gp47 family protein [Laribacter hongkongensis]|uniref:baseplate J/gp47 family protein n=1 Tax=Laribacter hongkongensis TaxID=168471 RepID=UPI001EFEC633|nr:baseplate J/gp47 family protein [Laribacter hongkongensis]MCG8993205.1 baseplate J/gp47 family protein [Laribacter hongkongensis]MCG8997976.1 baseplate J/gp47 family protein [Laribacter hongkongensis]MCG9002313.1 baseplate J/gp47 family protein [Laribacter hongkongensis]MCG9005623.1 baseplate J/gp47 family protein [Laribacter hongkongensis]MCG9008760.1 baseplate J/gp47 family protein [Laribacter hongkongensis]
MPFIVPTFAKIRDDLLRDLKNQLPDADTGPDSDYFIRATSVASAIEGLYQHQAWIVRQIFPDTADREYLELHARVRGLTRKPAVAAQGQARLTGTPSAEVPSGLTIKLGERVYITTQAGVIDPAGSATVAALANMAGTAGNAQANTPAELTAAPAGITSQVVMVSMTGGVDEESDGELLARLLELIRRPPAGGNKYDYRRWAMEVPGVSAAYVYPLRRGLGTVDVVITSAGSLPSAATLAVVQTHIDDVRPVTAKHSLVLAATEKVVNVAVAVQLSGITFDAAKAQIGATLTNYFNQLEPGETAIKSRIEALVSDLSGVVDRAVTQPAANVVPLVDATKVEWVRLGTVTVVLL